MEKTIYRGPFGPLGGGQGGGIPGEEVPPRREDEYPRSLPEDRSEGNLNPDPVVECKENCPPAHNHHPSGEAEDDDGAGNPLPREDESHYGLEDADELEWAQRGHRAEPDE